MRYIQPVLPGVLLLLVLAIFAIPRWRRFGRSVTLLAAVVLFLWSWPPTAMVTAWTLERWYPAAQPPAGSAEAIVVLAGFVRAPYPSQPVPVLTEDTTTRLRYASWLHRTWEPLPIVVSGGPLGEPGRRIVVAEVMKEFLIAEGVPEELVWTETQSQSTYENARNTTALLKGKGIAKAAVVTEGYHMLRAEHCFRKEGLEVVPAPCSMESQRQLSRWTQFIPSAGAIAKNEDALHEWVGLLWYRIKGRI